MKLTGLCGWSWVAFGASVGGLGTVLGPLWAVLGRSCGLCWRSWAALEPLRAVEGRSWGLCWRSWAALGAHVGDLGAYVGGLGTFLGPMLAVLAALGAYVGGPGRSWAEKWPKPELPEGRGALAHG